MQVIERNTRTRRRSFLREALAGTNQDFTEGSLSRGIALLAIPTMLEMAMESAFSIVDAFWVARLGADALAAVGLTEGVVVLVFSIALGLSMAATATVARRVGEKDHDGAASAAGQAIVGGAVVGVATGLAGVFLAARLLGLMGAPASVIRAGAGYARIVLGGNVVIVLLFLINGVFRGSGDAAAAMRTLWLANLINMALDPCFIYGFAFCPRLGVTGAAVATTIGRSIGVVYQLSVLFRGKSRVRLALRHLRPHWPVMGRLLRVGSTAMVQYFISTASWVSLARINARFGSAAIAGYTLGIRIIIFALMPSWGIAAAAATLVGQNLGAGRPERSARAVWMGGAYNMAFLSAVAVCFFAAARPLVTLFTADAAVVPVAVACLQYVSLGYPCYAWVIISQQAFNGAGDTATPTWMNFFCYWLLQIPLAWCLSGWAGLGPRGVYLAICIPESVLAVVGIVWFRRGKWKEAKV
jgi:putative MATE family efflux protein